MDRTSSLFDSFGGIRPMARVLGEAPSTVAAWKRVGRIPAEKQPHVLDVGSRLGLNITADHVVFPLGRPYADDVGPSCRASLSREDSDRQSNRTSVFDGSAAA